MIEENIDDPLTLRAYSVGREVDVPIPRSPFWFRRIVSPEALENAIVPGRGFVIDAPDTITIARVPDRELLFIRTVPDAGYAAQAGSPPDRVRGTPFREYCDTLIVPVVASMVYELAMFPPRKVSLDTVVIEFEFKITLDVA
jgi:hypothetical protein